MVKNLVFPNKYIRVSRRKMAWTDMQSNMKSTTELWRKSSSSTDGEETCFAGRKQEKVEIIIFELYVNLYVW